LALTSNQLKKQIDKQILLAELGEAGQRHIPTSE
jgi:hypothetical protein